MKWPIGNHLIRPPHTHSDAVSVRVRFKDCSTILNQSVQMSDRYNIFNFVYGRVSFFFLLLKSLRLKSSIWSWFSRLLIFSGHTVKLSFSKNKHDYKFRGAPRSASSHVFSANWTGVAWKADIHFIKTRMAIKKTMKPAFEYFSIKPIGLRVMPNSCG